MINTLALIFCALAGSAIAVMSLKSSRTHDGSSDFPSMTDPLTGALSYSGFCLRLQAHARDGYVISGNIRQFHVVSNFCGPERCNDILIRITKAIDSKLLSDDICGHVCADSFVFFISGTDQTRILERLTEIDEALRVLAVEQHTPPLRFYYGATLFERGKNAEMAVSESKRARSRASLDKNNAVAFFTAVESGASENEREVIDGFEKALQNNLFEVWYQPKFSATDCTIEAAEALVRWRRDDGSIVSPASFIPLLESSGLICKLDEYMLRTVCRHQRERLNDHRYIVPVSINLSRATLYRSNVVEQYAGIAESYNLGTKAIAIEITESSTLGNEEILEILEKFYKAGFSLHLDDFGRENSSVSALSSLPIDTVKLDKILIDYLGTFKGGLTVKHIIALCKELNIRVTAEGVETKEQLEFLRRVGCDSIQGYLLGKPVQRFDFWKMLDALPPDTEEDTETGMKLLSTERMRRILEDEISTHRVADNVQAPTAFYRVCGETVQITQVNERFCELFGIKPEVLPTIKGVSCMDYVWKEDIVHYLEMFDCARHSDSQGVEFEARCLHMDGYYIWCHFHVYYLRHCDGANEYYSTLTNVNDKYVRRLAMTTALDLDGKYTWMWDVRAHTLELFCTPKPGVTHPEFPYLDKEYSLIEGFPDMMKAENVRYPKDYRDRLFSYVRTLGSGSIKQDFQVDVPVTISTGEISWLNFAGRPLFDELGNLKFVCGYFGLIMHKTLVQQQLVLDNQKKRLKNKSELFSFVANITTDEIIKVHYSVHLATETEFKSKSFRQEIGSSLLDHVAEEDKKAVFETISADSIIANRDKLEKGSMSTDYRRLYRGRFLKSRMTVELMKDFSERDDLIVSVRVKALEEIE